MFVKALLTSIVIGLGASLNAYADDALHVVVDDAWAGATGVHFSGRLTEVRTGAERTHNKMHTLYRTTRMLLTSGEEGPVAWHVGEWRWTVRTDDDGYWTLATNAPLPLSPGWHEITTTPPASSPAGLFVVDPRNRLGLISDIDDTILKSDVTRTRMLLANSLAVPPGRREAVPGMAALYRRLLASNRVPDTAAVFYVSSSPRQLTDNLRTFLANSGFPRGVLRLKELSEASTDSLYEQKGYKLRTLTEVFAACPDTRFVLFGDDGEHDPEIYAELQKTFPDQIEAVWIRRVHPDPNRAVFPGQGDTAELLTTPEKLD